jgi:succinate-semialdehyde dehydrogenase / glutarate-semialdehyde dehydrogenase
MESRNPATGEIEGTWPEHKAEQIQERIVQTRRAHEFWRATDFSERGKLLHRAAGVLREKRASFARLMAKEMGKPVREGQAEVDKCAWVCEYYADNGERQLASRPVESDASKSQVVFRPLGVVLAIMPWNFPFWQVFRFAAPCLMAGNAALLKHASNVTGCALAIEKVFRKAGFPKHLFTALLAGSSRVGQVIDHKSVAAVTLTGSTAAGKAVAERAGRALKKTVLELGGSDPYLILEDADLESAVEACVTARLLNAGQSCIAAKRFLVVQSVREEFERRLVDAMKKRKHGDPLDETCDLGPLARLDLRDELHHQVQMSIEGGAHLLLGGEIPEGPGAYYPPTVLTEVPRRTPAWEEELFGPVAAIIPVRDEDRAVEIANQSVFGLGAAVFTRDTERGERIATEKLEAGSCFVNDFVRSDPRLPFGGIKQSGYGRELSEFGIREFVNVKTVWVK